MKSRFLNSELELSLLKERQRRQHRQHQGLEIVQLQVPAKVALSFVIWTRTVQILNRSVVRKDPMVVADSAPLQASVLILFQSKKNRSK